jgi:tetratricopeptide (TPR) repeat protein
MSSYLGGRADKVTHQMELNRERAAYFRNVESVMRHDIQLAIIAGRARSAVYLAQRLVDFDAESENLFWLAESYRALGPRAPQLTDKELTNSAKKDASKKREKRTFEEEERELLATPAGQENWQKHQQLAEDFYKRALNAENPTPVAHRGLGMLYEKLARRADAAAEYEKYLELSPTAGDRQRIQRRIETLKEKTHCVVELSSLTSWCCSPCPARIKSGLNFFTRRSSRKKPRFGRSWLCRRR